MENTDQVHFQLSDYLMLDDDASEEDSRSSIIGGCPSQSPITLQKVAGDSVHEHTGATTPRSSHMKCKGGKKMKMDVGFRIAFRTKSELEIMDDGFKWRKYGKKSVKNSSNPRNYYRCSSGGCTVKKRVERDNEDPSYVITSYVGIHNHESPCVLYYNQIPLMVPDGWSLQSSHSSCNPHSIA
ncbi:hypothetical protein HHK36_009371 [Tetracentron sinense]|uniref:WRKY domain-containing protein n=1 Tax=Tetracentron sinense TaxID=13715 RepID=A0A834ZDA3_TETSI|nr:hypothetical protein HHK36_009371 [Tetracentron sinense]